MTGFLTTFCDPMAVRSTNQFNPFADRLTDELPSPSTFTMNGLSLECVLTYPPCQVWKNWDSVEMVLPDGSTVMPDWIVQAFRAFLKWIVNGQEINGGYVDYDREACERQRGGVMKVYPCNGVGQMKLPDGRVGLIRSMLPLCYGRPEGRPWQWWRPYWVEAVEVRSTVEF